jgi:hypothetical protein
MSDEQRPRRDTIDMLREAVRYTESAQIRAAKVTRELPIRKPGFYSIVTPRDAWEPTTGK